MAEVVATFVVASGVDKNWLIFLANKTTEVVAEKVSSCIHCRTMKQRKKVTEFASNACF